MNTENFLDALFGSIHEGALEFMCQAPKGVDLTPRRRILWKPLPLGWITFPGSRLDQLNQAGYGISVGVAVRREKKQPEQRIDPSTKQPYLMKHPRGGEKDALYLTTLWIDLDAPAPLENAQRIGYPPSITVSSGGGHHCYYLLDAPLPITPENIADVKRTLKGMAILTGADRAVAELARTLRLPGTINTKPERNGARCAVIDADLSRRYPYATLAPYGFYAGAREPDYPVSRTIPDSASTPLPRWVEDYLSSGAPSGERNHTLFRAACSYAERGRSYEQAYNDLGARASADGLEPGEIKTAIKSAYQHAHGIALPRHLAQRMSAADRKLKGN